MSLSPLIRSLTVIAGGLVLAVSACVPAIAADRAPAVEPGSNADPVALVGGVDDFTFDSFDVVYQLARDDNGRSTLRTVEHLVARFPDFDQNRGIIRALVTSYQGHDTSLSIVSITDENGAPRPYSTQSVTDDNGESVLNVTIAVPVGQFVRGEQHYVIEYTQRNVTAYFADTDDDEFYWDTNGDGWRQPFGRVSVTVELTPDLARALTGAAACYQGGRGSTLECEITYDGSGAFTAEATDLAPFENVSIAIGFDAGTFAPAPITSFVPLLTLVGLAFGAASIVLALVLRLVVWRNKPGRGTIIAQYEPPAGVSAMLAANILGKPKRGMAATIVDLAVRRKIRMLERDSGWAKVYGVQKIGDTADLLPDEQSALNALFGYAGFSALPGLQMLFGGGAVAAAAPPVGEVRWLAKRDTVLGQQVVALTKAAGQQAIAQGLRHRPPAGPIAVVVLLAVAGIALLFLNVFVQPSGELGIVLAVVGTNVGVWLAIFTIGALVRHRPLTSEGSRLLEHLLGLREYIRLAEADRLQMLQSVTGAERVHDPNGRVIKIYERLLPYAVLFGLEKEWGAELAKFYEQAPPDWYDGSVAGFHVAAFTAGLSSFSSSISTSYSGSSSGSSSSGGSGGGGSSGGGGGGGGGGGV